MASSPRLRPATAAAAVAALALAGCTVGTGQVAPPASSTATSAASQAPTPVPTQEPEPFVLAVPQAPAVVVDTGDPVAAALAVCRTVFAAAPVVVLAAADDVAAQLTGASAAVGLGAPLLLVPPDAFAGSAGAASSPPVAATQLQAELSRLGTRAVLVVGDGPAPTGIDVVRVPAGAEPAQLAAVTGRVFGAAVDVPAGGETAAAGALGRPGTVVLRAAVPAPTAPPSTAPARPVASAAESSEPAPFLATFGPEASAAVASDPPAPGDVLLRTAPAEAVPGIVALVGAGGDTPAALATLRAAGLPLVGVPAGDPRATAGAVEALAAAPPAHVVALGAAFGPADRLAQRVAAASTGAQLPGGGQLLFPQDVGLPGKRYVALYGSPGMASLGVLGEQDVPATIARAQQHAEPYRALTSDTVVPGVEIIATIASAGPGEDGNYSAERPVAELLPLVQAAGDAGMTVVLDLQPGRTDFLTQAKQYQELLLLPHVSLALDPEWRLEPDQVHLRQIGHVGIDEVDAVAAWLAQLVRDHRLPQKMLVLHQFMLRMIDGRERLDTSHDELAMVIHVDGQGGQGAKLGTWDAIRQGAPPVHWGWKNFYDEDTPAMLDPAATSAISPQPDLVTYQ